MKNKLNSLLVTAALTLSAAAAYGQNHMVVANIPFGFQTAADAQIEGKYGISQVGEAAKLVNLETGKASFLAIGVPEGVNHNRPPQLVFTCRSKSAASSPPSRWRMAVVGPTEPRT